MNVHVCIERLRYEAMAERDATRRHLLDEAARHLDEHVELAENLRARLPDDTPREGGEEVAC